MSSAMQPGPAAWVDPDGALVDQFLGGDRAAFDTLYQKHYAKVYGIALGVLLNHDDAAEATQEIFASLYLSMDRFDRRAKFTTWLYRVATNRAIQYERKIKRHRGKAPLEEAENAPAYEATPSDPALMAALGHMSTEDRSILTLLYWDELSIAEIAAIHDCSEGAMKTRLSRARNRLKEVYLALSR